MILILGASFHKKIVSRAAQKGRSKSRRRQISRLSGGHRGSSSVSGKNGRRSGGPGKEATECICPTGALNHPRNFSVDNWLPALEPNGWLTRFNMLSLPRENDMEAASEAATSVTNYVIFTMRVYGWWTRSIVAVGKLFNRIREMRIFFNKKNFQKISLFYIDFNTIIS